MEMDEEATVVAQTPLPGPQTAPHKTAPRKAAPPMKGQEDTVSGPPPTARAPVARARPMPSSAQPPVVSTRPASGSGSAPARGRGAVVLPVPEEDADRDLESTAVGGIPLLDQPIRERPSRRAVEASRTKRNGEARGGGIGLGRLLVLFVLLLLGGVAFGIGMEPDRMPPAMRKALLAVLDRLGADSASPPAVIQDSSSGSPAGNGAVSEVGRAPTDGSTRPEASVPESGARQDVGETPVADAGAPNPDDAAPVVQDEAPAAQGDGAGAVAAGGGMFPGEIGDSQDARVEPGAFATPTPSPRASATTAKPPATATATPRAAATAARTPPPAPTPATTAPPVVKPETTATPAAP